MTFEDFTTYLSAELPSEYIVEGYPPDKIKVYDDATKKRGISLDPTQVLETTETSYISTAAKVLIRTFEKARMENNG